jgi:LacI family transcriptional regulator
MKKRVTIKDIAIEAGVSTGTVHRAIYGKKASVKKRKKE